jgi:hypothetical protein
MQSVVSCLSDLGMVGSSAAILSPAWGKCRWLCRSRPVKKAAENYVPSHHVRLLVVFYHFCSERLDATLAASQCQNNVAADT